MRLGILEGSGAIVVSLGLRFTALVCEAGVSTGLMRRCATLLNANTMINNMVINVECRIVLMISWL